MGENIGHEKGGLPAAVASFGLVALAIAIGVAAGCAGRGRPPRVIAEPTEREAPEAEVNRRLAEYRARGYVPVGRAVSGELESFEPLTLFVERDACYVVHIRLLEGAELSEHASRGTVTLFRIGRDQEVAGAAGLNPAGGFAGGCADSTGRATFDVNANWGSANDRSRIHDLGHGPFAAQLYVRKLDSREVAERQAHLERQEASLDAAARRRSSRACQDCGMSYEQCVVQVLEGEPPIGESCFAQYFDCLERQSVQAEACLPY